MKYTEQAVETKNYSSLKEKGFGIFGNRHGKNVQLFTRGGRDNMLEGIRMHSNCTKTECRTSNQNRKAKELKELTIILEAPPPSMILSFSQKCPTLLFPSSNFLYETKFSTSYLLNYENQWYDSGLKNIKIVKKVK